MMLRFAENIKKYKRDKPRRVSNHHQPLDRPEQQQERPFAIIFTLDLSGKI
jgi:hypothetical protein